MVLGAALGGAEIAIIGIIVVLVFGAGWLPKAARNLGRTKVEMDKASEEFRKARDGLVETVGLEKANETFRKADRALKKSPGQLLKDATKSSVAGASAAKAAEAAAAEAEIEDAEIVSPSATDDETINVTFDD